MNDTESAQKWFNAGLSSFNNRDYDQAIAEFTEALTIDPDHIDARRRRGSAYMRTCRMPEAIRDFNRALALSPADARTYNLRGLAYASIGRHDHAVSDYDRAVAIDPGFCAAHMNRSNAISELQRLRQSDPSPLSSTSPHDPPSAVPQDEQNMWQSIQMHLHAMESPPKNRSS